jgi:membrane-associated protein
MHELLSASTLTGGFDLTSLLRSTGPYALAVIALVVFVENGLLFPFLPGDSLVFAAALLVVSLGVPLWLLIVVAATAAIVGDLVGYAIGARLGRRLFKPDAKVFKSKYRDQADAFLNRYGALALVLARFVPIVRTFLPPIVGASTLRYRRFVLWNIIGGVAWATSLCLAGFWLGKIPAVANNIELIAVALAIVSLLPVGISILRRRLQQRKAGPATSESAAGSEPEPAPR